VLGPIMLERAAELEGLVDRLDEVAELTVPTVAVPVQLEGRLKSGELFYFRARGESASLSLWRGAAGLDDVLSEDRYRDPDAYAEARRWDWPEAGWLEIDDVADVFRELLVSARAQLPAGESATST